MQWKHLRYGKHHLEEAPLVKNISSESITLLECVDTVRLRSHFIALLCSPDDGDTIEFF